MTSAVVGGAKVEITMDLAKFGADAQKQLTQAFSSPQLRDAVTKGLDASASQAGASGKRAADSFADGITASASSVTNAGERAGKAASDGAAQGISEGKSSVTGAAGKVGEDAGKEMGDGVNSGLSGPLKMIGAAVAGAGIVAFVKDAITGWQDHLTVLAQTQAAIKSTGGAAGVTKQQLDDLSSAIESNTGVDGDNILAGENMLLTFTNIKNEVGDGNDVFNQATQTLIDMSVATGQDAAGAAVSLGKALNDPIAGIAALSRVGVTFTDQQKEQITTLVQSGKTMEAQKIILAELNKEFGGSAAAQNTPAKQFTVAMNNLKDSVGQALLPVLNQLVHFMTTSLLPAIQGTIGWLSDHSTELKVAAALIAAVFLAIWVGGAIQAVEAAGGLMAYVAATKLATGATALLGGSIGALGLTRFLGVAGLVLAVDQIRASATNSKSAVSALSQAVSDLFSGHPTDALKSLTSPGNQNINTNPDNRSFAKAPFKNTDAFDAQTFEDTYGASAKAAGNLLALSRAADVLNASVSSTESIADYSAGLDVAASSTQKLIDHTKILTSDSSDNAVEIGHLVIDQSAWSEALKETNGDQQAALKLVEQAQNLAPGYASALDGIAKKQATLTTAIAGTAGALSISTDDVTRYATTLGITGKQLADGTVSQAELTSKIHGMQVALANANPAVQGLATAMTSFASSTGSASDKSQLLAAVLKASQGDALSYTGSLAGAYAAVRTLTDAFKNEADAVAKKSLAYDDSEKAAIVLTDRTQLISGALVKLTAGSIDYTKNGAGPLVQQLQSMQDAALTASQAIYQHELSTKGDSQALTDAQTLFNQMTNGTLVQNAKQLGLTAGQAQAVADNYFKISDKDITSTVQAIGLDDINTTLIAIGQMLANVTGQPWNINVNAKVSLSQQSLEQALDAQIKAGGNYYAAGGLITGPGSGTSDSVPIMASNGEYIFDAATTAKNRSLFDAIANGRGIPNNAPATQFAGGADSDIASALNAIASRPVIVQVDGRNIARAANTGNVKLARIR